MENIKNEHVVNTTENKGIKGNWGIIIIIVALIAVMVISKIVLDFFG